jgi:DNA repair exonuclease SbcCD ATPase subunit
MNLKNQGSRISEVRRSLLKISSSKTLLEKQASDLVSDIRKDTIFIEELVECREIMHAVFLLSKQKTHGVIEHLVTSALQSVYGNDYEFKIETRSARNQNEACLIVYEKGKERSLRDDDTFGGIVDLVSFSLRIVLWAVSPRRTSGVFILDEPARSVDKTSLAGFGNIIRHLSEVLGIQFIIITHEEELAECGNRSYLVTKSKDGVSSLERIS